MIKNSETKSNLPDFEAVIFDMDGVIVNSEPYYVQIEKETFEGYGLDITPEEHLTFQGIATTMMWERIKKAYNLTQPVNELISETNKRYVEFFDKVANLEAMPGVEDLIKKLKDRNIPIALATSSIPELIKIILDRTGLEKYFETIVHSGMVKAGKPAPDIFLLTAEKAGVSPEKCIVIEDSANGIKAAKAAGMFCIGYAGPGSESQDQSLADLIIKNYDKLIF